MILSNIKNLDDLKKLPEKKLSELSQEIRKKIIEVVAENGGHLASNLGCVELTIAIHRVFNSPKDAIIFDVSHQSYTHKLLTGRYKEFPSIRKHDGISGFTKRCESEHDYFDNGHSSTSISQGIGLLTAWELNGEKDRKVVVVIGDGALTGGMAYEGLCHAGQLSKNLIVILNDNQMSISENTGALSRYLSTITMSSGYQRFRHFVDGIVDKIPYSQHHLGKIIYRLKRGIKGMFLNLNFFTDFGFEYVGPLDGHDIKKLENVLNQVRNLKKPVVVHVRTIKGKGYSPAENDPASYHGVGPFLISNGVVEKYDAKSFTEIFSNTIVKRATENEKIVAITAAMSKGTGLDAFRRKFSNRFFDVGIAEEHAVTFASGLSCGGKIPVVAIYSTFMQRAVDQVIHDIAIPKFHAILMLDRAGVVPSDGETHQGLFDIALFRNIPNLTMLCPASENDFVRCFDFALETKSPIMIRYPKSSCPSEFPSFDSEIEIGKGILLKCAEFEPSLSVQFEDENENHEKILLVTTGSFFCETLKTARILLQSSIETDIFSLRFLKPFDEEYFSKIAENYNKIIFIEDGVKIGGIGEYLQNLLSQKNINVKTKIKAFPDRFLSQGNREQICEDCKMNPIFIAKEAIEL